MGCHPCIAESAVFSPDGLRVVTLYNDGTVEVWVVLAGLASRKDENQLAEISEAVSGYQLDDSGSLVGIPVRERIERLQAFKRSKMYQSLKIFPTLAP